jgi:hypothetical protein
LPLPSNFAIHNGLLKLPITWSCISIISSILDYTSNKVAPFGTELTVVGMRRDDQKTECWLKLSAKNVESNRRPLKSQVFQRVHWELNSSCRVWICHDTMSSGRNLPIFWTSVLPPFWRYT